MANTSDFDAAKMALRAPELLEIDRYALVLADDLQKRVLAHFDQYEFQPAMQLIQNFCSEDLGGFYLDILKDRLYTTSTDGKARRAAQTALHHILQMLTRLIAPVMSFTAEEIWSVLKIGRTHDNPHDNLDSVFLHGHHALPQVADADVLKARWTQLREIRSAVSKQLEATRTAGEIGSSLQAEVTLAASGGGLALLKSFGDDLRFAFITSQAKVAESAQGVAGIDVKVAASAHSKCERCWHYRADVGSHAGHATLCNRCVDVVVNHKDEDRHYA